ncbi:MAG: hypothetical protein ACHQIO_20125 [Nevskiales bacterium]
MSPPADQHPGISRYSLLGMIALTLMIVALLLRRPDAWALFPALLGALALTFRWRAGPVIVLLAVILLLLAWRMRTDPGRLVLYSILWVRWWAADFDWWRISLRRGGPPWQGVLPFSDLLLALSLLAYAAGQYRLQGLTVRLFPPDWRRRRAAARQGPAQKQRYAELLRRPPQWVTIREFGILLAALAICGVLTSLLWTWLLGQETNLELDDPVWRGILVLWLLGGGLLIVAGGLRYLALRRMTPAEAQLYLQDLLWQQTRREQRRLNRWLAWAWLSRRRREEKEQS